ncbi:MAG TPA: sugar phosphate nucleotidyltransferase [Solirubrobacteraceae bacterium]
MPAAIADAIVPVAGLGTRLLPATRAIPKELLPVGRLPVLQHVIEELAATGVRRVLLVTAAHKTAVAEHFAEDSAGLDLFYVQQHEQRGLGDAVAHGAGFAEARPVAVALGDCLIGDGTRRSDILARLDAALREHGAAAAVAVEEVAPDDVSRYGIVDPDDEGEVMRLRGIVEKPDVAAAPSRLAVAARYVLAPEVFDALRATAPGRGGEVQLTDALAALIAAGRPVVGVRLRDDEPRHDVGDPVSYARAFCALALADPELAPAVRALLS